MVVENELAERAIAEEQSIGGGECLRGEEEAPGGLERARQLGDSVCRFTSAAPGSRNERLHLRPHFTRRLVAQFRRFLQRAQDDLIEPHVDLHFARRRLQLAGGEFASK